MGKFQNKLFSATMNPIVNGIVPAINLSTTKSTLAITGTEDTISRPVNYLNTAKKINGTWIIQIQDGGHGVMFRYP